MPVWIIMINRIRVVVGRSKEDQVKWDFMSDESTRINCDCEQLQTMYYLRNCPSCPTFCTMDDIETATKDVGYPRQYLRHNFQ